MANEEKTDDTTASLPKDNRDLLDGPNIAHLATARPDGGLQSNPVWFDWDGTHVRISQTTDRQKVRNLMENPHVALSITDPENPYRYLEVRGVVEKIDRDADNTFIDDLSERYMGKRPYPMHHPGDERVIVHIRPTAGSAMAA
jgi:PPOX class probable F420-dependent enzyme